ncbi:MAG: serine/threonine protein kinase [Labilithrix sp.]|nr:serine/threonine protein kinase [Labilithrix sp.]
MAPDPRTSDPSTRLPAPGGVEPSLPVAFGKYTPLDRLGSGGMADVFLALAKGAFDTKKLVVVKRPRTTTGDHVGMFMDEARLAMRLNHPNVVQTYDVGIHDGALFLAMEYLEGQPLHAVSAAMLRHGEHLSHPQLARIAADALAGLHYAHELADYDGTPLQIVHRDVSPHNLFVTYEGQIKVVDFGIAKATMNQVHTETGSIKGKLAYMAPEHALGSTVDRRADVFAMGVILWELVARRRLVTGATSAALLTQLLTMEFPPLSAEVADVHPILEAVVLRALQREPSDRFATALEMREALESYIRATNEPVHASDIGRVVDGLFTEAREQMSTRIRMHMQSSASSRGRAAAAGVAAHATTAQAAPIPTAVTSIVDPGPGANASPDTNTAAIVTPPVARARPEWRTTAAVLALSLSILVLAGVLLLTRSSSTPDRSAAHSADPAPAPTPTPTLAPTPTPALTPAATLTLTPSPDVQDASVKPPPPLPPRPLPASRPPRPASRPIDTSFPR